MSSIAANPRLVNPGSIPKPCMSAIASWGSHSRTCDISLPASSKSSAIDSKRQIRQSPSSVKLKRSWFLQSDIVFRISKEKPPLPSPIAKPVRTTTVKVERNRAGLAMLDFRMDSLTTTLPTAPSEPRRTQRGCRPRICSACPDS